MVEMAPQAYRVNGEFQDCLVYLSRVPSNQILDADSAHLDLEEILATQDNRENRDDLDLQATQVKTRAPAAQDRQDPQAHQDRSETLARKEAPEMPAETEPEVDEDPKENRAETEHQETKDPQDLQDSAATEDLQDRKAHPVNQATLASQATLDRTDNPDLQVFREKMPSTARAQGERSSTVSRATANKMGDGNIDGGDQFFSSVIFLYFSFTLFSLRSSCGQLSHRNSFFFYFTHFLR
jgi:type IV secretory pathway VirB10-like protein